MAGGKRPPTHEETDLAKMKWDQYPNFKELITKFLMAAQLTDSGELIGILQDEKTQALTLLQRANPSVALDVKVNAEFAVP